MQSRSCQGLPGEPEILRVYRYILFYCALLYCTSQVLCLLQMKARSAITGARFVCLMLRKERQIFNTSEFGIWRGLLIGKVPTQKMGELILQFILRETKIQASFIVMGREGEARVGCETWATRQQDNKKESKKSVKFLNPFKVSIDFDSHCSESSSGDSCKS